MMRMQLFSRRSLLGGRRWYFRVRAANGEIVAQSDGYSRKIDARLTARELVKGLARASFEELA